MIAGMTGNHHFIFSLARFADIDPALEVGTLADRDAPSSHIPSQRAFTADVDTVAGIDITAHLAQDHHFTSSDICRHQRIPANGHPAIR